MAERRPGLKVISTRRKVMRQVKKTNKNLVQKMQQVFFDLSPENVLVYQDPIIGQLANRDKQLAVVANLEKAQLELKLAGQIEEVFELSRGIAKACRNAFGAYFKTFEALCQQKRETARAA